MVVLSAVRDAARCRFSCRKRRTFYLTMVYSTVGTKAAVGRRGSSRGDFTSLAACCFTFLLLPVRFPLPQKQNGALFG
ncbi:hypothetical protein C8J57DRAFT_1299336 [Mycena rebaudengoi]|nr:hypothetical protein C8J57DRAFT_1299336 [Mycena rebaudengoi]